MNSLKAFLSPSNIINTENDLHADLLNVLIRKGQPVRVFDRAQQSQPFVVVQITDPEALTEADVAALAIIAEQPQWIVVVDDTDQVSGVIEPQRTKKLQIATNITIKPGEFGAELGGRGVVVSVSFYGCLKHPEEGRFALYDIGQPIPHCPVDGEAMIELEKRGERAEAKPYSQKDNERQGWFARLLSRRRKT